MSAQHEELAGVSAAEEQQIRARWLLENLDADYAEIVRELCARSWPAPARRPFDVAGEGGGEGMRYVLVYDTPQGGHRQSRQVYIERHDQDGTVTRMEWQQLSVAAKIETSHQLPIWVEQLQASMHSEVDNLATAAARLAPLAARIRSTDASAVQRLIANGNRLSAKWQNVVSSVHANEMSRMSGSGDSPRFYVREQSNSGYGLWLQVTLQETRLQIVSPADEVLPAASFDDLSHLHQMRVTALLEPLLEMIDEAGDQVLAHSERAVELLGHIATDAAEQYAGQQALVQSVREVLIDNWERAVAALAQLHYIGQADVDLSAAGPRAERLHLVRRSGEYGSRVLLERDGLFQTFGELPIDEQLMVLNGLEGFYAQLDTNLSLLLPAESGDGPFAQHLARLDRDIMQKIEELEAARTRMLSAHHKTWAALCTLSPKLLVGSERPSELSLPEPSSDRYELAIEIERPDPQPVVYRRIGADGAREAVPFEQLPSAVQTAVLRAIPRHCAAICSVTQDLAERAEVNSKQLALFARELERDSAQWGDRGSHARRSLDEALREACEQLLAAEPQLEASAPVEPPAGAAGWDEHDAPILTSLIDSHPDGRAGYNQYRLAYGVFDGAWALALLRCSNAQSGERVTLLHEPSTLSLSLALGVMDALSPLYEEIVNRLNVQRKRLDAARKRASDGHRRLQSQQLSRQIEALDIRIADDARELLSAGWGLNAEVEVRHADGTPYTDEGIVAAASAAPGASGAGASSQRTTLIHGIRDGAWALWLVQRGPQYERAASLDRPDALTLNLKLALSDALPELARQLERSLQREIARLYGPRTRAALVELRALEAQLSASLDRLGLLHLSEPPTEVAATLSEGAHKRLPYLGQVPHDGQPAGSFVSLRHHGERLIPVWLQRDADHEQLWHLSPLAAAAEGLQQPLRQLLAEVSEHGEDDAQQVQAQMRQLWMELTSIIERLDELALETLSDAREVVLDWPSPLCQEVPLQLPPETSAQQRCWLRYDGPGRSLQIRRGTAAEPPQLLAFEEVSLDVRLAALRAMPALGEALGEAGAQQISESEATGRVALRSLKRGLGATDGAQSDTD